MPIKININKEKVAAKISNAWEASLGPLSEEILNDCNEYAKFQEGGLIDSSLTHSIPKQGKLIWQTPYARRQYWEIPTNLSGDAKRGWKWCEAAKARHKKQWERQAQKYMDDNLK